MSSNRQAKQNDVSKIKPQLKVYICHKTGNKIIYGANSKICGFLQQAQAGYEKVERKVKVEHLL